MTSAAGSPGHQVRHVIALVAGLAALAAVVWAPGGLVGDLVMLVVGVAALLFAGEAGSRPGPLRALAIAGAVYQSRTVADMAAAIRYDSYRNPGMTPPSGAAPA